MNVLDTISPDQVRRDPFPHVVVENALDPEFCNTLIRQFPPLDLITQGERWSGTRKYNFHLVQAHRSRRVSRLWKETMADYVSSSVWRNYVRIFGDCLMQEYPTFELRFGPMREMRVGIRNIDDFSTCDVLLDSKIVVHTPSTAAAEIERLPHLKLFRTVVDGYIFLRPDEDEAEGADFDLCAIKPGHSPKLGARHTILPDQLDVARRVSYRKNTLVMFINTPRSVTAVTARPATKIPYMAFHFTAHLRESLFEHDFAAGCGPDSTPVELMYPPHRPTLRERFAYRFRRATGRL